MTDTRLAHILMCEDNEGDIELTKDAFEEAKIRNTLSIVRDGEEALDYLYQRNGYEDAVRPDMVLLDLNMPKTDGKEVLEVVKKDPKLKRIPFIVLTSSAADTDVVESYDLSANCYIVKPIDAGKFVEVVRQVNSFWIDIVHRPNAS